MLSVGGAVRSGGMQLPVRGVWTAAFHRKSPPPGHALSGPPWARILAACCPKSSLRRLSGAESLWGARRLSGAEALWGARRLSGAESLWRARRLSGAESLWGARRLSGAESLWWARRLSGAESLWGARRLSGAESLWRARRLSGAEALWGARRLSGAESLWGARRLSGAESLWGARRLSGAESLWRARRLSGAEALWGARRLSGAESLWGARRLSGAESLWGARRLSGAESLWGARRLSGAEALWGARRLSGAESLWGARRLSGAESLWGARRLSGAESLWGARRLSGAESLWGARRLSGGAGWSGGLSASAPVHLCEHFLVSVQQVSGLPWWLSIVVATLAVRTLITLPLATYQMVVIARVEALQAEISELAKRLRHQVSCQARERGWTQKHSRLQFQNSLRRIVSQLYVRDNCHPFKAGLLVWVQLPLWISLSLALRNLSLDQSALQSELAAGGTLWFPDLTLPDPIWILPVCVGLTNLLVIEVFSLQRLNPSRAQRIVTNSIRALAVLMIPVAASVPSSMALYWFTSSLVGFSYNIILRSAAIHKILNLQTVRSESPYRDLLSAFIRKYWK